MIYTLDRLGTEELVDAYAVARAATTIYQELGLPVPEERTDFMEQAKNELSRRRKDILSRRLKQAEQKYETLKPAETKRQEALTEIERLKAQIAVA